PLLPPDVADADRLLEELTDTDVFGPDGAAEALAYAGCTVRRAQLTLALLPDLAPGAPVLELGANPYMITRLLERRGLAVTCANWFSPEHPPRGEQTVTRRDGSRSTYAYDHFDVERDPFPYPDATFEVVLCC